MTSTALNRRPSDPEALTTLTWPAARFYWAFIESGVTVPALAIGHMQLNRIPEGLLEVIQGHIPEPLGELHAVAVPWRGTEGPSHRTGLLVCAARIADLRSVPPSVRVLAPATAPEFLGPPSSPAPGKFNLLVGAYEPAVQRRRRRLRHTMAALWLVGLTGLILVGLHRRTQQHQQRAATARTHIASLLSDTPARSAIELASLVERSVRVHEQSQRVPLSQDATTPLVAILAAWPSALGDESADETFVGPPDPTPRPQVEVQSLYVQHARASISAVVSGGMKETRSELAERLLGSFRAPPGWTLQEPRWTHQQNLTRLSFSLARSVPSGPASASAGPEVQSRIAHAEPTTRDREVRP